MAWIESHTVLLRHRKVLQLATDLSLLPVYILGHLHALWHAVLEQQEDGDLTTWPNPMIAHAAAFEGNPDVFVTCLQSRKWLDGKLIHDWIDYAGLFLTKKYSTSNQSLLKKIWKKHGYKYGERDRNSLHRIANRKRTESELQATLPNLTRPNQPNQPNQRGDDTFEQLWEAYPWKAGKQEAEKAWKKLGETRPIIAVLLNALKTQKQSKQWTKDHGEYIPRLSTWLNQARWNDQLNIATLPLSAGSVLPKSYTKLDSATVPFQPMPDEVKALLVKVGRGKDMPS